MSEAYPFANLLPLVEQLHDCVGADVSPEEIQFGLSLIWSIQEQLRQLKPQLRHSNPIQSFEDEFSLMHHSLEKIHDDLSGIAVLPHISLQVYIEYIYLQVKELLSVLNKQEAV